MMSDSDDENVLYAPTGQDLNHQGKGLLGNGVKNVNDILNGPTDTRRVKKTIALCGAFIGLGLAISVIGPTLQDLQVQLHADLPHVSYIFTGRSAGYVLGSILGGLMYGRFHPLLLITISLGMSGIGLLVTPYCHQLLPSVITISFVGLAMGALDTGANVICLRMWGKKSSPFMQALHFSFALGAFIAPLLAGPFIGNSILSTQLNASSPLVTNVGASNSAVSQTPSTPAPAIVETANDENHEPSNRKKRLIHDFSELHGFPVLDRSPREAKAQLALVSTPSISAPVIKPSTATTKQATATSTLTATPTLTAAPGTATATPASAATSTASKVTPALAVTPSLTSQPTMTATPTTLTATPALTVTPTSTSKATPTVSTATTALKASTATSAALTATPTPLKSTSAAATKAPADTGDTGDKTTGTTKTTRAKKDSHFQGVYVIIATFLIFMALVFTYFFCTSPLQLDPKDGYEDNQVAKNAKSSDKYFTQYILILLFLFYFLYVGAEVGYGGFIYTFAIDNRTVSFTPENATHLNSVFWGTFAFGRGLSICVASVISPLTMIVLDLLGCSVSSLALAYSADDNAMVLWVGTAILGASMASLFPSGISWLESYAPVTGNMASFLIVGAAFGEMAIPVLLGHLFDPLGPMSLMYVMFATSILTAGIFGVAVYLAATEGKNYDPEPAEEMPAIQILQGVHEAIDMQDLPFTGTGKGHGQMSKHVLSFSKTHKE